MLFPYVYTKHPMEMMQSFVDYIFFSVWCQAPCQDYSIELFSGLPELQAIIEDLDRQDKAGIEKGAGAFFYKHVNLIFSLFKGLTPAEIAAYEDMYRRNNDIEELCSGRVTPTRYTKSLAGPLWSAVEEFFSKLYSSGFFSLGSVKAQIGADIRSHYNCLVRANKTPSCPFCGLYPIDTEHDPTREAYDHYLPRSKYPFNSVNLRNLAPACYKCNSGNKLGRDPLWDEQGNARRAFYPYSAIGRAIEVSTTVITSDWKSLKPSDLTLTFCCPGYEQEIQTWENLYRIQSRYAAKCCSPGGGEFWINRVLQEHQNYNCSPREMLEAEIASSRSAPWVEANFLKAAFLTGCDQAGLLD